MSEIDSSKSTDTEKIDEFSKANSALIVSLQNDNKSLREELSGKEKELHSFTVQMQKVINEKGSVSEQFLIGSLQSARESISGLDLANQELLDAELIQHWFSHFCWPGI